LGAALDDETNRTDTMKRRTEEFYRHNDKTYKRIIEHYIGMKDSIRWKVRKPEQTEFSPVSWFSSEPNGGELENDLILSSN
jgi:hypothetical protein